MERVLQELDEWIGNREEGGRTIMGGDFNARVGREGGGVEEEGAEEGRGKGKGGRRMAKLTGKVED